MIRGSCLCGGVRFEIAAGLLDADPGIHPDRHIFIELKAPCFEITDDLPQLTKPALAELRRRSRATRWTLEDS